MSTSDVFCVTLRADTVEVFESTIHTATFPLERITAEAGDLPIGERGQFRVAEEHEDDPQTAVLEQAHGLGRVV